jgi:hypothetical protein
MENFHLHQFQGDTFNLNFIQNSFLIISAKFREIELSQVHTFFLPKKLFLFLTSIKFNCRYYKYKTHFNYTNGASEASSKRKFTTEKKSKSGCYFRIVKSKNPSN